MRYIPVRINADTTIEGTETLLLGLEEPGSGLVLGSPSIVRVKIDPRR